MINNSYSIPRIEEEIEKCIVLCGNCHRVQHYGTYGTKKGKSSEKSLSTNISKNNMRRRKLRIWVYKLKSRLVCYICKYSHPRVLDFHHILEKKLGINEMVHRGVPNHRIVNEIKKCIPLCVNCHRKIHNGLIEFKISEAQLEVFWAHPVNELELKNGLTT